MANLNQNYNMIVLGSNMFPMNRIKLIVDMLLPYFQHGFTRPVECVIPSNIPTH